MYVSAELIIAANRQASIKPTRPRLSGPRISLAATPQTRSGSAAISELSGKQCQCDQGGQRPPNCTQPLQKVANNQTNSCFVLGLGRTATGGDKVRLDHDPHHPQQRQRNDVLDRKLAAARSRKQAEIVRRNTLVHDAKTVHQPIFPRTAEPSRQASTTRRESTAPTIG